MLIDGRGVTAALCTAWRPCRAAAPGKRQRVWRGDLVTAQEDGVTVSGPPDETACPWRVLRWKPACLARPGKHCCRTRLPTPEPGHAGRAAGSSGNPGLSSAAPAARLFQPFTSIKTKPGSLCGLNPSPGQPRRPLSPRRHTRPLLALGREGHLCQSPQASLVLWRWHCRLLMLADTPAAL